MSNEREVCQCGRDGAKLHCSECGRFACYAKSSKARLEKLNDGSLVKIMMYHCRGCGVDFDDINRAQCSAPRRGLSVRVQRIGDAVATAFSLEGLSPTERKVKLAELFKRKDSNG